MCPTGTSPHRATAADNPGYRSAFDVLDADHDGKISPEDLRKFYPEFTKSSVSKQENGDEFVGTMISVADENKDGFVEYDEFEKVLNGNGGSSSAVMREVFGLMDRDGDGIVGREDLRSYLKLSDLDLGEDEINAMIKLGRGNENGGVTFDGFIKILAL